MTYNIAGGHAGCDLDKLAAVMLASKADLICIQEVFQLPTTGLQFRSQAHELAAKLRMNCVFGAAIDLGARGHYGNAILSRFTLHSVCHVPLPRGSLRKDDGSRMPGATETRLALAATVSPVSEDSSQDFVCICAHFGIYNALDAKSGEASAPAARIFEFLCATELPALLLGDLNCPPKGAALSALFEMFEPSPVKGPTTHRLEIDHVLASKSSVGVYTLSDFRVLRCASCCVGVPCVCFLSLCVAALWCSFEESCHASDHLPVLAEWRATTSK